MVEECTKVAEEVKISEHKNVVLAYCILCYFQWSLQSTLELMLILFTKNTWTVIKKMFLNMIMSFKQKIIKIKWEKSNK